MEFLIIFCEIIFGVLIFSRDLLGMVFTGPVERKLINQVTYASFKLVSLTQNLFKLSYGESRTIRVIDIDDNFIGEIWSIILYIYIYNTFKSQ